MSCSACQSLAIGQLLLHPRERPLDHHSYFQSHHSAISELCNAALSGCRICIDLWSFFFKEKAPRDYASNPFFISGSRAMHVYINSGTYYRFLEARRGLDNEEPKPGTLILEFGLTSPMINGVEYKRFVLEKINPNEDFAILPGPVSWRQTASGRMGMVEYNERFSLERRWKTVESWMSKCSSSHRICQARRRSPAFLPTRLLYVPFGPMSPEPRYHLVDLSSQAKLKLGCKYLTLSHRWAVKTPSYRTTQQNIAERLKHGIPRYDLPMLFTDTIDVAFRLRVPYIWIDTLCIIQGDTSDWRMESSRMVGVYMNSFLNISATLERSTKVGLSSSVELHPRTFRTCWENPRRAEQYRVIDPDFWKHRITDAEINSRGWVLQERSLAPRVLHYASDQLIWECCEVSAAEEFPDGIPAKYFGDYMRGQANFKQETSLFRLLDTTAKQSDRDSYRMFHDYWRQLSNMYARCELTEPDEDKLVAISGLANAVQRELGDQYLAGLWKGNLIGDLLWHVHKAQRQIRGTVPDGLYSKRWDYSKRATNYRAPSWSWASVDGLVILGDYLDLSGQPHITEAGDVVSSTTSSPMAIILDVTTTPVQPLEPFGQVFDGKLIVKGKMYRLGTKQGVRHQFTIVRATEEMIFDDIDEPLSWDTYNEAYFLPLARVMRQYKRPSLGSDGSDQKEPEQCKSSGETFSKSDHDFAEASPVSSKVAEITKQLAAISYRDSTDTINGIEICPTLDRGAFRRIGRVCMSESDFRKFGGCTDLGDPPFGEGYFDSYDLCKPDTAALGGDTVIGVFEIV